MNPDDAWRIRIDQTAAHDTLLCGRLRLCTVCSRAPTAREGIWTAVHGGRTHTVAYGLCPSCLGRRRETMTQLDRTLRERYGVPLEEGTFLP